MKMILWVEDQEEVITKIFSPALNSGELLSEWLIERHHIHWVDSVDDALTALSSDELEYDYFLLDVALPAIGEIDDYSEVTKDNLKLLETFIGWDGWKQTGNDDLEIVLDYYNNNHLNMNAGMYLYLYLVHTKNIRVDQIRIYSGHTDHIGSFKTQLNEKGVPAVSNDFVFDKATSGDAAAKKWLEDITSDQNAILHHAMIEGCNQVLNKGQELRQLFSKNGCKIKRDKIESNIRMIKNILRLVSVASIDHSYYSLLVLLLTSEVQEILSKDSRNVTLDEDFKKLMGVLDRIRNMFVHNKSINPTRYNCMFIAFTFLIFLRAIYRLPLKCEAYEKNILSLFTNRKPENLSNCIDQINDFVSLRCNQLRVTNGYYKYLMEKGESWSGRKYTYQNLLGDYCFTQLKYPNQQYQTPECYRLFLLNFLDYNRAIKLPLSEFFEEERASSNYFGRWEIYGLDDAEGQSFSEHWYDDYFKFFYQAAFQKPSREKKRNEYFEPLNRQQVNDADKKQEKLIATVKRRRKKNISDRNKNDG